MNKIKIIRVAPTDIQQLQAISKQTFIETFANQNTVDNMQKYIENNLNNNKLLEELSNPCSEFYFATCNAEIIGYLKINYGEAQTELKNKKTIEIERIYVLKSFQGQGVGQALYETALTIAQNKKSEYVWLGVWEKNKKAINFYKKNNFIVFDKHIFKLGNDEQTDIMMRLKLC